MVKIKKNYSTQHVRGYPSPTSPIDQNFFSAGWLFNVMQTISSILRSNIGNKYLLYIYESIEKAMNIKARDRESIKKVIVLSSITNSYVERTA